MTRTLGIWASREGTGGCPKRCSNMRRGCAKRGDAENAVTPPFEALEPGNDIGVNDVLRRPTVSYCFSKTWKRKYCCDCLFIPCDHCSIKVSNNMPKDTYVAKKELCCLDLSIPCHWVLAISLTCVPSCAHLVLQRHMFHLSKDETFIKYVFVNMMTILK